MSELEQSAALTSSPLAVLILAAGGSTRLGQAKQLVKFQDKPLITHQIEKALTISTDVYCVLGANFEAIYSQIKHLPINVIVNQDWQQGMSNSIACGTKALIGKYDAVLILLVDQWQLTKVDLQQLVKMGESYSDKIIVSQSKTSHRQYQGPPVIFPKEFFADLSSLTGDNGAKAVIKKYPQQVRFCSLANAAADLDTPEQLKRLQELETNN